MVKEKDKTIEKEPLKKAPKLTTVKPKTKPAKVNEPIDEEKDTTNIKDGETLKNDITKAIEVIEAEPNYKTISIVKKSNKIDKHIYNKDFITKLVSKFRLSNKKNIDSDSQIVKKEHKTKTVTLYKLNLYVLAIFFALIIIIAILLISTPLLSKLNLGRYGGYVSRDLIIDNIKTVDSLKAQINVWRHYNKNISDIIAGDKPTLTKDSIDVLKNVTVDEGSMKVSSYEDVLREQVMIDRKYEVKDYLYQFNFFKPINGVIEVPFSKKNKEITLAVRKHSTVVAINDGTVVASYWDPNKGYVMQIQHSDDILSTYGLITKRGKKIGDKVLAGEVIGYVGDSDIPREEIANITKIYRLNFALWHKGNRVNPANYIVF